jgi:hypothetical protein
VQQKESIFGVFGSHIDSIEGIYQLDDITRAVVQSAFRRACYWSFISLIPWCVVAAVLCLGLRRIPEERLNGPDVVASVDEKVGNSRLRTLVSVADQNSNAEATISDDIGEKTKPPGPSPILRLFTYSDHH